MKIRLGLVEHWVRLLAILPAPVLPALALMAQPPRWHHMLPLDATGAVGLFADLVAAAGQVYAELAIDQVVIAAAIESNLVIAV